MKQGKTTDNNGGDPVNRSLEFLTDDITCYRWRWLYQYPHISVSKILGCPKMIQNGGDLRQNSGYPKIAIFKYSSRENDEKLSDFGIPHFRMIVVPRPGPLQIYLGCESGVICRWSATFRRTTWWPSLDNFLPNRFGQELGFTMENHHLN